MADVVLGARVEIGARSDSLWKNATPYLRMKKGAPARGERRIYELPPGAQDAKTYLPARETTAFHVSFAGALELLR
ncbi:hypothetical protein NMY22_g4025 [Coprinellus aureogranulatus]|nr:hypothetical protein NMY22_g4025 [Coprinellus aureogranulatus]